MAAIHLEEGHLLCGSLSSSLRSGVVRHLLLLRDCGLLRGAVMTSLLAGLRISRRRGGRIPHLLDRLDFEIEIVALPKRSELNAPRRTR